MEISFELANRPGSMEASFRSAKGLVDSKSPHERAREEAAQGVKVTEM